MTPDLIARLREEAERQRNERGDMLYRGEADPWLTEAADQIEALREAMQPFLDLRAQRGAHGVISKLLDDLSPMQVTVTKSQMLRALAAYRSAFPEVE